MKVLIIGGGRSGSFVASKLKKYHKVTVIESDKERIESLRGEIQDIEIIKGDGCEPHVLEKANIKQMDIAAALTGDDEDNLVISFLSKFQNNVPLVFARINNPKNEWLFDKNWGVDIAVSSSIIIANLIQEEVSLGEIISILKLKKGNVSIDEINLPDDSSAAGRQISQLNFPNNIHIIAIVSGMNVVIPKGDTLLHSGDKLFLISEASDKSSILKLLGIKE
ncbi:MAG: NAD-binding protein [Actinobacteria bacterium]|nr:NAD-binding protein [Actinomycetota bacterium]